MSWLVPQLRVDFVLFGVYPTAGGLVLDKEHYPQTHTNTFFAHALSIK